MNFIRRDILEKCRHVEKMFSIKLGNKRGTINKQFETYFMT